MDKSSAFSQSRFYKVKKAKTSFLCALCRAPRQMKYSKNLSLKNYLQMTLLMSSLGWLLASFIGLKALFAVVIIWPIAEATNKILYRKEIPCPYCGFDATWYRRDVKVARQKVEDYWSKNFPELVNKKHEMVDAVSEGSMPAAQGSNPEMSAQDHAQ